MRTIYGDTDFRTEINNLNSKLFKLEEDGNDFDVLREGVKTAKNKLEKLSSSQNTGNIRGELQEQLEEILSNIYVYYYKNNPNYYANKLSNLLMAIININNDLELNSNLEFHYNAVSQLISEINHDAKINHDAEVNHDAEERKVLFLDDNKTNYQTAVDSGFRAIKVANASKMITSRVNLETEYTYESESEPDYVDNLVEIVTTNGITDVVFDFDDTLVIKIIIKKVVFLLMIN